jgi:hypothetical protein
MASKKKDGEAAERAPRSLTQRAVAIVKILETCTPEERSRVMLAVDALSGPSIQVADAAANTDG